MALAVQDAKLGWRQRVQVGVESVALGNRRNLGFRSVNEMAL